MASGSQPLSEDDLAALGWPLAARGSPPKQAPPFARLAHGAAPDMSSRISREAEIRH
jgi:hypothetical protein